MKVVERVLKRRRHIIVRDGIDSEISGIFPGLR